MVIILMECGYGVCVGRDKLLHSKIYCTPEAHLLYSAVLVQALGNASVGLNGERLV